MLFTPRPKGMNKDNFLKLNDKEEVTGLFSGDIYTFRRHWDGNRGVECSGEGCGLCKTITDKYPAFRFRVNFLIASEGKVFPKIFEGGGETYDSLTNLDRKYDLSKTVVEITRRGLKMNTKYDFLPLVNQQITKELESKIKACELLPLSMKEDG
jgi:hypothetical protein